MYNFIFRVNLYLTGTSVRDFIVRVHNFIVRARNFILHGHPSVHQE